MADRYFCSETIKNDRAVLDGAEARHLGRVMRAKPGDLVVLFDGSGSEFLGRIDKMGRDRIEFMVESHESIDRELPFQLTLAIALPKGDRQRWLIEKLVELGATRLVPLRTERSVVVPKEKTIEKLRRTVIEATKQSGRNRLMEIAEPVDFSTMVGMAGPELIRWIAHPGQAAISQKLLEQTIVGSSVVAAIGPEGGFSDDELSQAELAGWQAVALGPRILRIETAALAIAARLGLA
jgi:16S rRNA (uracil1498-N3)-methyltransferase